MKASNRKRKGKKFEEKVAEIIHNYFYETNKEYRDFIDKNPKLKPKRAFASGNERDEDGDIQLNFLRSFFPFSIECKHHKDLNITLNNILTNQIKKLMSIFINQTLQKAEEQNLKPLLVFAGNRTDIFCMTYSEYVDLKKINNYVIIDGMVICLLKDFLENRR